jgi:PAS domain S-box-containing protein
MPGSYNYGLVALSILIAMMGSYATINLAGRITANHGGARLTWRIGGATALAIGTWSMHYTGMLAFRLPVPIRYDWPTSLLAFLPSLFASAVALVVVVRPKTELRRALIAALFMGGGIAALHYTAMASMRLEGMCHYSPTIVTLSTLLAMIFSLLSLWLMFLFRDEPREWKLRKVGSVALLGSAIWVMHYTGMASARFTASANAPNLSHAVRITALGALGIGAAALTVLSVALFTATFDRLQSGKILLDGLFEQAPQGIVLLDEKYRIVRVNRGFTKLFGYAPEEAIGRQLRELIAPEEAHDELQKLLAKLERGERIETEAQRRRKDGSRLDVAVVHLPVCLPEGRVARYAIYRDITRRKQDEQRLREYEQAVEGLDEMIVVVDRDCRYLLANRAFLNYRNLKREQLLGQLASEILNPGVFESSVKSKFEECLHGHIVKYELKYDYPTRGERDLLISYFPIEGPAGIDRVVCVLKDITEAKQAEAELKRTNEQLRALSAGVQAAKEEEATRIAREIHDELGATLTSLRWDLEEIDETISSLGEHSHADYIRKKIASMTSLTDKTVNIVRRIASELRPISLDALGLGETIEGHAQQFQERTGIIVECDWRIESSGLSRDQTTALFRIFQEALTNILRHAQATRVRINLGTVNDEFILNIRDNGRGITNEEKSGQRTLGLLGMRERAHLIGATIDISRSPSGGTVVTVRIPLRHAEPGAQPATGEDPRQ